MIVSTIVKLLNQHDQLKLWKSDDMAKAHKLGKKQRGTDRKGSGCDRPRPGLVKFSRDCDKGRLFFNRTLRKERHKASITISDDLTIK